MAKTRAQSWGRVSSFLSVNYFLFVEKVGKIPDCLVKTYDENGNLKWKGNYKDDKLNGLCKRYYKNGQLEEEGNYKHDKENGVWEYCDEKGVLLEESNW